MSKEFEYLVLFAALSGRKFSKSELGITLKVSEIDRLVAETKLLEVARKGRSLSFSANQETFHWAGANLLSADLDGKNKAIIAILQLIRAKTDAYLKANKISFADFLQRDGVLSPADAVRRAYLSLSGGAYDMRVLLKDLRKKLSLPREAQDAVFFDLIRSGEADFYPEDDPMSRNEEDDSAALLIADRRRHIVYLHSEPRA